MPLALRAVQANRDNAGSLGYGPQCKAIGKSSYNNLVVTSSSMMVQRLGPISPVSSQVTAAGNDLSPSLQQPMNPPNLVIPHSGARSLLSRESLASTTLNLSESQSTLSVKQEWPHRYRILPSLPSQNVCNNESELGELLSIPPGTAMSNTSVANSLPSYLFGGDSPQHSAWSLLSRESLASTTLNISESQSTLSVKQEWPHRYRILPSLPSQNGCNNESELGELLSIPPGTAMSNTSVANSLPSYLFGGDSPQHSAWSQTAQLGELLSIPPGTAMSNTSVANSLPSYLFGGDSPQHSAWSQTARSKKRALSLSPLSDGIGIDFNTIIRTSPTSLVAYINGSKGSPANISPQPEVYGHFLGVRGSCIPQACLNPGSQRHFQLANSVPQLQPYSEQPGAEYQRMQQLEQGNLQYTVMNNMVVQQGIPLIESKPLGSVFKSEQMDTFSHITPTMDMSAPPQGPPPPYHSHQHLQLNDVLTQHPHHPPNHLYHGLPSSQLLEEDGELDDFNGKHCCQWIDCSAVYDQQEEMVRHIEKVHIDQRKGEDFTCFWAGCPRRYKSFNARYKLLIHMRVHSGEKPNNCTHKEIPSEAPPIHPDVWQELTSSWHHTWPQPLQSLDRVRPIGFTRGIKRGLVQFPSFGSTIPALAQPANLALLSKDAACPNKQCRVMEGLLKNAYSADAFVARLGNYNTCLVAYQSHIWSSAAEGGLTLDQTEELRLISRMLLRLSKLLSQATGWSMAALVAARRQLWFSQARLTERNKAALLDASITPGHTFGPAVDDLLLRSKAAREATKAFSDLPPKPAPPPKKQWYRRPPPWPQWQPQGSPRDSPAASGRLGRGRGRQKRFQRNAPDKKPQAPKPKQQP
ncbi:UNVERIFIED_CONTAM: hypothetical protein FKN15_043475 [Acipenser sinensis]